MSPLDRSLKPEGGAVRHFDFPEVVRSALPNGVDLRVARIARLPLANATLFLRAGEQELPPERAGLAVLTGEALEGGTRRRSGSELAEALERIGARLDVSVGWEGMSISVSSLADRLEEAFALLIETVLEPSFQEDEVSRVRDQQIASIRQRRMDPGSLATDAALARYYAAGVPYARPVDGTPESVAGLGREAVQEFARVMYRPGKGSGLIVAGDVDPTEIGAMALERFSGWEGAPPPARDFEVRPAARDRRVWVVDRPGSVQSEIRVGHVGVARDTPDYFALGVANLLLGGTFTSRLNLNLRERNGFTYGIRSRFTYRTRPGHFQVATAVGSEVTAPAVREIVGELERLVTDGPGEEEVVATRDFAAGLFGLQLETIDQISARVAELVAYGLPDPYFHEYRDRLRAVSVEEVAAAARRHVRPGELQIVVVGDAGTVTPALEALDLGPVEVVAS